MQRRTADRAPAPRPVVGGYVTATQVISVLSERLAEAFSQEILVKTDLLASSEGEIELSSHRDGGDFGRIMLSVSTSSARQEPRYAAADIRRLAMDVRAK